MFPEEKRVLLALGKDLGAHTVLKTKYHHVPTDLQ